MKSTLVVFSLFVTLLSTSAHAFDLNLTYGCLFDSKVTNGTLVLHGNNTVAVAPVLHLGHDRTVVVQVKKWPWSPTTGFSIALKDVSPAYGEDHYLEVVNVGVAQGQKVVQVNHDITIGHSKVTLQCFFKPAVGRF